MLAVAIKVHFLRFEKCTLTQSISIDVSGVGGRKSRARHARPSNKMDPRQNPTLQIYPLAL